MPPLTIILNDTLNHSITYDPSTDAVTVHLQHTSPIEKVPNKQKLMLLIYFCQRDLARQLSPRKIESDVTLELRIVERIIWQFSNHAQALRTLKEYAQVGNKVDTTLGMGPTRTEGGENGRGTRSLKMDITREVHQTLLMWFQDILAPDAPDSGSVERSGSGKKARKSEVIDLSSVTPDQISSEDVLSVHPAKRRKTSGLANPGTSNGTPKLPFPSQPPSSSNSFTAINFPKPPSTPPLARSSQSVKSSPISKPSSIVEISDTPSAENSSFNGSRPCKPADIEFTEGNTKDNGETEGIDLEGFAAKVAEYVKHLYFSARAPGQEKKTRKYSRKLKRLSDRVAKGR